MKFRPNLTGIKTRLLALMAFVILPIALASVVVALRNYRAALAGIETERAQITNDYSVRTRIWYRGLVRALASTYAAVEAEAATEEGCARIVAASLKVNPGFRALRIATPGRPGCYVNIDNAGARAQLDAIAANPGRIAGRQTISVAGLVPARYDITYFGGARRLVIHIDPPQADGAHGAATLLVDPALLEAIFAIGPLEDTTVALVRQGAGALVTRGASAEDDSWNPQISSPVAGGYFRFASTARGGGDFDYATSEVAGPELHILARFSDTETRRQRTQFLFMTLTPLAILGLLFLAYSRAIQADVVRWILGVRRAALARIEDTRSTVLAPVNDDMPLEIRSVATAFNAMVSEGRAREQALERSIEDNRALMRELHHHVKNSLQVIQSYMALSRRHKPPEERRALAEIEARVLVLSIAYRLALGDSGMRPVSLRPFTEEIVANLAAALPRGRQRISVSASEEGMLNVDQIIPFGLAIVECVTTALAHPDCEVVTISMVRADARKIDLIIDAAPRTAICTPNARIMLGLALQLKAEPLPTDGALLRWRLTA